jgi:cysteinyl-tRNA synthetase
MSRKKEDFHPLEENKVKMYVCGPTVYNYIHIGNARSRVAFDVIRQYFQYRGYEVNFISNFTDVDDKIIKVANETNTTAEEVAEKYITAFNEDMKALNVEPASFSPRAMDCMENIIEFIEELIEKGYAYEMDGDVFFRTEKSEGYGKLANKTIDELQIGASGRVGEEALKKENPVDFALWKPAKEGEPSWASPWGNGRPGWHIECSVMAERFLGKTIDIHGGGSDLEFPHHTNEIAQSEAKNGQTFANYWMHNGFVVVGEDDEKMSKSIGNFVTVHDLLKTEDGMMLHFMMASTHYRRPIRFSAVTMAEAKNNLTKIKNTVAALQFRMDSATMTCPEDAKQQRELDEFEQRFTEVMDDDFNSSNGLTVVYSFVNHLFKYLDGEQVSRQVLEAALSKLQSWMKIFGVSFETEETDEDAEIDEMVAKRNHFREIKDFANADAVRDELKERGISILDTPQGTRWARDE